MFSNVTDYTFTEEVLEASSPVLVNFWAPWCGLCRLISPVLASLEANSDNYVKIVGVNADDNLKLASTYRLKTLPTLLLFEQGRLIHRIDSFHGRDDLKTSLEGMMRQLIYSV